MEIFNNSDIDSYIISILSINILFASILIFATILRYREKISNVANTISISSVIVSIVIIMSGINNADIDDDILQESIVNLLVTSISLCLIKLSKFNINKIFLINTNLKNDNVAASLIYCSISISSAIFMKMLIIWTDGIAVGGIKFLAIFYLVFEIMQLIFTSIFSKYRSLENAIKENSLANIFYYFSYRVGLAFTIATSFAFIPYDIIDIGDLIFNFVKYSSVICIIYVIITKIIDKIIDYIIESEHNLSNIILKSVTRIAIAVLSSSLVW